MELYCSETGPKAAPSIVFLHGGGLSGWMWQPQLQALGDYHCLVPDLPEHGRSMAEKPFTIQDSAARIAELIENRAHGGTAHVVGLSLGAQVLVALLSRQPELVDHAMINSANMHGVSGSGLFSPGLLKATYRLAVQPFKNSPGYLRLNMKSSAGVPEQYFPQFQEDVLESNAEAFTGPLVESLNFRLPTGLERVRTPTLAIAGHKEPKTMRNSLEDLVAAIPGALGCLLTLPGRINFRREHTWNLNFPELFNAALRAWIEGTSLPAELVLLPNQGPLSRTILDVPTRPSSRHSGFPE